MKEVQHLTKKTSPVIDIPNLVELQLDSYRWFLEEGLKELFDSFSPITDFTGNTSISLIDFTLSQPKYSVDGCRDRDATFETPIKVKVQLTQPNKEMIESEVYLGDLPLMTDKGTFVINGAERVVVSQLARSPGVYFKDNIDISGRVLYYATIIPSEGVWVDVESDANTEVTVRIGQTRKFPVTTLIRALGHFPPACIPMEMSVANALEKLWIYRKEEAQAGGHSGPVKDYIQPFTLVKPVADPETGEIIVEAGASISEAMLKGLAEQIGPDTVLTLEPRCDTTKDIINLFSTRKTLEHPTRDELIGKRLAFDLEDPRNNKKIIIHGYEKIDRDIARRIEGLQLESLEVLELNRYIDATLLQDSAHNPDDALLDIYRKIRPSDPATQDGARTLLLNIFYDPRRYGTAKVGRYKINRKLGNALPLTAQTLTRSDLIGILRYMINLDAGEGNTDDIDHLENKRVRSVGELLYSQLRLGFLRMEKVAKERMTSMDTESALPSVVLSVKPVSAAIKSFFGSSQLSQFMDQTNPLAELAHKRRLSALGPGGLSRQSAKLEVRDVHHSHYGRICPIETPEGPNIGLIGSLAIHARVDAYGFLETPYRKVKNGVVTHDIEYLTADVDHHYHIAPANEPLDSHSRFIRPQIQVRYEDQYPVVAKEQVELMDVSPMQIVSVAAAMIPFLENDDVSRALMGSNMQRQAVPTLRPEAPLVKTGIERRAALDSGAVVIAWRSGTVTYVTSEMIEVTTPNNQVDSYRLLNMLRSNQATCITQRPLVNKGQRVRAGQVIADGPCTDQGELALGQNVLVAFVPWGGYNYEDAVLLSERLVKDDVYTSIHIEKYETEARDTKLGPEEITRDIPNVGEEQLKDLDENGIIRIGAEVRPEDILVGKVAPKGQGELTAEERLIIAIFGKKAEETRDVSLRVPHGEKGRIVDVKVFSRFKYQCGRCKAVYNYSKRPEHTICDRCQGELVRLPGDELAAGVNQLVRVYIAQKRKVMEGNKMAGRHGNKGVVSKILPEEDMPFLPDGTPVDIVLNPLGVPSRMNIGQILETHLGLVGRHLNCSFVNPPFEGSTEQEILEEMDRLARHQRALSLSNYLTTDLRLKVDLEDAESLDEMLSRVEAELRQLDEDRLETISRMVAAPPVTLPDTAAESDVIQSESSAYMPAEESINDSDDLIAEIVNRIKYNAWIRAGIDPETGKIQLRDGLTGEYFNQPITVGHIYMMKLAHLVDDKIHARSTGPYSLVTQQPLGGKAQFGGQRFGEMEVWALEAYGAAYTLQEILTIKSDDVMGRVKTYESIVKGDNMLEPGVPESFKILVNELQSLGLRVVVEDGHDQPIDLKDHEDENDNENETRRTPSRRFHRIEGLPPHED